MKRRFMNAIALSMVFVVGMIGFIHAQGTTNLLKGKVIDEAGNVLKGVQVVAKFGDETAAKSKTTSNGEFTMVLKPGNTYMVNFDRHDIFAAYQDITLPASNTYKEINQTFTLKTYAKGNVIGSYQVFQSGKTTIIDAPIFETLQKMMKKMSTLKIAITVSAESLKPAKKAKPSKKKGAVVEPTISPVQQRLSALSDKLESLGISKFRCTISEGVVKKPSDISITVTEIESGF